MTPRSFNKVASIITLIFFIGTPVGVFAQCGPGGCAGSANAASGLFGGGGSQLGGIGEALIFSQLLGGGRGLGGFGGGGGGGGPTGIAGQALTLAGALTGNVGLLLAGMITSMIGGFTGGGATPQRGAVDEGYFAPGQAGPYGAGYGSSYGSGYNPYYTTPTPVPATNAQTSCKESIFIARDTTVTPNVIRPYPNNRTLSISQNECVLALNTDTASHTVQVKEQGSSDVKASQSIAQEASHKFKFESKKTYLLCVDSSSSACTTVAVGQAN